MMRHLLAAAAAGLVLTTTGCSVVERWTGGPPSETASVPVGSATDKVGHVRPAKVPPGKALSTRPVDAAADAGNPKCLPGTNTVKVRVHNPTAFTQFYIAKEVLHGGALSPSVSSVVPPNVTVEMESAPVSGVANDAKCEYIVRRLAMPTITGSGAKDARVDFKIPLVHVVVANSTEAPAHYTVRVPGGVSLDFELDPGASKDINTGPLGPPSIQVDRR